MSRLDKYLIWRWKPSKKKEGPLRPKVVVFDFDGTLADTFGAGFEILNTLAEEFGFRGLKAEELEHARDMRTRQLMKFLGIPTSKMARIAKRGSEELKKRINGIQPLPGVPEVVRALHERGYTLGVLTSNSRANVETFLANHDLKMFSFIRSSSKLMGKAREMRAIRKEMKIPRSEILFVGDETRDVTAAHKDEVAIAAVTWGYNSRKALEGIKPTFLLESPDELVVLLDELKEK